VYCCAVAIPIPGPALAVLEADPQLQCALYRSGIRQCIDLM